MKNLTTKRALRCAIYTRVSTDQGLEQDFNSLDAQREASEAYIKSQAHEPRSKRSSLKPSASFQQTVPLRKPTSATGLIASRSAARRSRSDCRRLERPTRAKRDRSSAFQP